MEESVPASGIMVNSGILTGTSADEAFNRAIEYIQNQESAKAAVNYKLRDWLISDSDSGWPQSRWFYVNICGWNPVPDDQLPVLYPDDVEWLPRG